MNILLIADTHGAGIESRWAEWGHRVTIIAARRVPVRAAFGVLARGLRVDRPDVVMAMPDVWPMVAAAWLVAIARRRPLVLAVRECQPAGSFWSRRAEALMVPTEGGRTSLIENGLSAGRIAVIADGTSDEERAGVIMQVLEIAAAGWGDRAGMACWDADS